jgi:hypothetical protein
MLPTLTIPSVAPPPQRGSDPANSPATEGDGGDAFADALQRARGEPKAAANESPSKSSKSAGAHARPTRQAQPKSPACEGAQQTMMSRVTWSRPRAKPVSRALAPTRHAPPKPAKRQQQLLMPPPIAIDVMVAPRAAIEIVRGEQPCGDAADHDLAIDDPAPLGRARVGGATWCGPRRPGALRNRTNRHRRDAATIPPHAALEREG